MPKWKRKRKEEEGQAVAEGVRVWHCTSEDSCWMWRRCCCCCGTQVGCGKSRQAEQGLVGQTYWTTEVGGVPAGVDSGAGVGAVDSAADTGAVASAVRPADTAGAGSTVANVAGIDAAAAGIGFHQPRQHCYWLRHCRSCCHRMVLVLIGDCQQQQTAQR